MKKNPYGATTEITIVHRWKSSNVVAMSLYDGISTLQAVMLIYNGKSLPKTRAYMNNRYI